MTPIAPRLQAGASFWRQWLLALAAAVLAMAARAILEPALGDELPFVFAFPAVVLVALRWGVGPALLTTFASVAWAFAPFVPPVVATSEIPLQIGAFCVSAILTILVCSGFAGPRASPRPSSGVQTDDTPLRGRSARRISPQRKDTR